MNNKKAKFDENSYCMLQKKCKEELLCDFCDKTFDSRYSNIIHNAHHIVIPLLKQELHQCKECLYYFQTVDGLVNHLLEKHNQVTALKHATDIRSCNIPSTSTNSSKEIEIIDISDDEPSENTDIKEEILNAFKKFEKLSVAKKLKDDDTSMVTSLKRKLNKNGCMNVNHEIYNTWNVAIDKKVTGCNLDDYMIDIKSEEYILPDVYYDVKISPNTDTSYTNSPPLERKQSISSFITHTTPENNGIIPKIDLNEEIETCLSVHYNNLTQPCNYNCKLCQNVNIFPNRYALTLHQISHLELSHIQPSLCLMCDKYFSSSDLKNHIKGRHWNIVQKNYKTGTCTICNFKYRSYKKHLFNYHHNLFIWKSCLERRVWTFHYGHFAFKSLFYFSNQSDTDIVELCLNCFKKLTISNIKCKIISSCKKIGCQLKCSSCKGEFLEIKFVEKWKPKFVSSCKEVVLEKKSVEKSRPMFVSKFKFEEDVKKTKKKTNENRLKNIRMRLKMINKLSRLYMLVSFELKNIFFFEFLYI